MAEFIPKKGPAVIRSADSNQLSDRYRDAVLINYRFLGNVVPDVSFTLNGRTFGMPIMAGPINSKPEYAQAAADAGTVYWMGFHDAEAWKQVLALGIPAIRVYKPLADNSRLLEEIRYDTEHGALGYAMDISHGMTVYGEPDKQSEQFASKTEEDLKLLNDASPLPFFLKDVQSVHDAETAKRIGAAGIVLSGHNNRFPCSVPPLMFLPEARKTVGDDMLIFVDGGMNTGYDIFKALALGADAVLCARGLAAVFAKDGAEAMTVKLLELKAELKGAMANTGSPDLKHISPDSVRVPKYY